MKPHILVVDDDELITWSLRERLGEEGWAVDSCANAADAKRRLREGAGVDLILLDFELPQTTGLALLRELAPAGNLPPVIMMTAYSTVEGAVEAMQLGAYHYIRKPFDVEDVVLLAQKALEASELRRMVRRLLDRELEHADLENVIGESQAMRAVKETVVKVATSPARTVLLTGESGTGKDVLARTLHALSDRRDHPFMNITCSALPEALLESELFGHERGAFTDARARKIGLLEEANRGMVFLDEIGEMPLTLQAKLLRFLEERAFRRIGGLVEVRPDVRVVAATNRDLQEAIANGEFREDLYYRLAVIHVQTPPLRERGRDVRLLANFFVDRFNRELKRSVRGFSPAALEHLESYPWPGNVRELRNAVERAVLLADTEQLEVEDLVPQMMATGPQEAFALPPGGVDLRELEESLVKQALQRTEGNKSQAAKLLGLTRDQMRHRVTKFGLEGRKKKRPPTKSPPAFRSLTT